MNDPLSSFMRKYPEVRAELKREIVAFWQERVRDLIEAGKIDGQLAEAQAALLDAKRL